jgi:hypothetical protein
LTAANNLESGQVDKGKLVEIVASDSGSWDNPSVLTPFAYNDDEDSFTVLCFTWGLKVRTCAIWGVFWKDRADFLNVAHLGRSG